MNVLMFVRKHIIPYEEWYTFYKHKDVPYNEEYSNSPLEGTNNAIKHFSSSTHPQTKLSNSMQILCEKSSQKMAIKRANIHLHPEKTSTNYQSEPVHDRITPLASFKL